MNLPGNQPRYNLRPELPCGHADLLWPLLASFHVHALTPEDHLHLATLLESCSSCAAIWDFDQAYTLGVMVNAPRMDWRHWFDVMATNPEALRELVSLNTPLASYRSGAEMDAPISPGWRIRRDHLPSGIPQYLAFTDTSTVAAVLDHGTRVELLAAGSRAGHLLPLTLPSARIAAVDSTLILATVQAQAVVLTDLAVPGYPTLLSPTFPEPDFNASTIGLSAEFVVVGGADGRLILWAIGTENWQVVEPTTGAPVTAVALDIRQLVIGDDAGFCRCMSLDENVWAEVPLVPRQISALAISPLGVLAIASGGKVVLVSETRVIPLELVDGEITCLAFAPDGRTLAIGVTETIPGESLFPRIFVYADEPPSLQASNTPHGHS